MSSIIDYLRVKGRDGQEHIFYPRTLMECITNKNGDKLEDVMHELINDANHLKRLIVETIPTVEEAEDNVIYMYKVESAVGSDVYQEYQLIDNEVVCIGDTSVDLSDYVQNEVLDKIISGELIVGDSQKLGSETAEQWQTKLDNIQTTSIGYPSVAGWYRIAEYVPQQTDNGTVLIGSYANSCTFTIKRTYGNHISEYHKISLMSVYGKQTIKSKEAQSAYDWHRLFTKARYTHDSTKAYFEVYYSESMTNTAICIIDEPSDAYASWKALPFITTSETVEGVTVTTTYDIPANASPVTDNAEPLTTSVLEKLISMRTGSVAIYQLAGSNYTGNDLPHTHYNYGIAHLTKFASNHGYIQIDGIRSVTMDCPPIFNIYNGENNEYSWSGWKTFATTDDITNAIDTINLGKLNIAESALDTLATDYNVADSWTYMATIVPKQSDNGKYLLNGATYTIIGMEYSNHKFGHQCIIGIGSVKTRVLSNGTWDEWLTSVGKLDVYNFSSIAEYDIFSSKFPDNTYYKAIITHTSTFPVLGGSNYLLEGVSGANFEWQLLKSYNKDGGQFFRQKFNGVWGDWKQDATKADLPTKINGTDFVGGQNLMIKTACSYQDNNHLSYVRYRVFAKCAGTNSSMRPTFFLVGNLTDFGAPSGLFLVCLTSRENNRPMIHIRELINPSMDLKFGYYYEQTSTDTALYFGCYSDDDYNDILSITNLSGVINGRDERVQFGDYYQSADTPPTGWTEVVDNGDHISLTKFTTEKDLAGYLPLSGGTNESYGGFKGLGYLGMKAENFPAFVKSDGVTIYDLLHTGNKPIGSYTGNGSDTERVINTGGIGKILCITNDSDYSFAIVSSRGYIGKTHNNDFISGSSDCFTGPSNLILRTNSEVLNASGVTYYYQVL